MKNRNYSKLEDFLSDESFLKWASGKIRNDDSNWGQWISQNPDKRFLVESAIAIIRGLPFRFARHEVDPDVKTKEWHKIKSRAFENVKSNGKTFEKNRFFFWKVAASFVLVFSIGFALQQKMARRMVVFETPYGEQLSVVLADSTTVKLNSNSVLKYRKNSPRLVWLDGEAFFHVKKKPQSGANFRVITNDMTIEVLGTSFNVIEKENLTEIILEEGNVILNLERDYEKVVEMVPGEMVAFSRKANRTLERRNVRTEPLTSWKDGILEFYDVPLVHVMNRIKEIYGWTASYRREELQTRNISIPLPSNDLDGTLNLLSRAIGVEIEKLPDDRILVLH